MRLEELYEGLLEEGISPIVYHVTTAKAFFQIMATNTFRLNLVGGRESLEFDISKNRMFFFSTARSKQSHYIRDFMKYVSLIGDEFPVILKLDGRKLNQRYTGHGTVYGGVDTELEDRVVSDSPRIPNAASYIISADVIAKVGGLRNSKTVRDIIKLLDSKNIPFAFYDAANARDALISNVKNALTRTEIDRLLDVGNEQITNFSEPEVDSKDIEQFKSEIETLFAMYKIVFNDDATTFNQPSIRKKNIELFATWYKKVMVDSRFYFENMHLLRDVRVKDDVAKIAKVARRHQFGNINEFGKHIVMKMIEHPQFEKYRFG